MHHLLYLMLLVKTSKLTQDYGSTDINSAGMQELFLVCPFLYPLAHSRGARLPGQCRAFLSRSISLGNLLR